MYVETTSICMCMSQYRRLNRLRIFVLCTGVLYRNLQSRREFHENGGRGSHTLLQGVPEFVPLLSTFVDQSA